MCSFSRHVCYSIVVYNSIVTCLIMYHLLVLFSSWSWYRLQGLSSVLIEDGGKITYLEVCLDLYFAFTL